MDNARHDSDATTLTTHAQADEAQRRERRGMPPLSRLSAFSAVLVRFALRLAAELHQFLCVELEAPNNWLQRQLLHHRCDYRFGYALL
ncbi:hypothetical protein ACVXHA_29670 [Escherichia coli]